MAMTRAELLAKIAGSSVSSGGTNLRDGRGRIVVKKLTLDDGYNGAKFTMDGVIVSSSKIPVTELATGKALDITPNEPGTDVGWVQLLDKHDSAFGAVKGFVLSLFGEESSEVDNEDFVSTLEELTSKNSALGMQVDYSTFRKITRQNKVEIVLPKWAYVEQSETDIASMKKWLNELVAQQKASA